MNAPRRIHILSDHVANKIAAGEVVDRPASVVKELIENALDAGASRLEVRIVDGGRKRIRVSDDGCGMSRDDALLALERHATSKILDVDDIECIATLGFRGEALAAIASVSRFTLTTRPEEAEEGTELSLAGGRLQEVREIGTPSGTIVDVRNLFFNVPARRKFLRSAATELAHVRQVFLVYALSYPEIAWRLIVDETEAYNLPGGATRVDRMRALYGEAFIRELHRVSYRDNEIDLKGYVGNPRHSRADRSDQYIFINRRPVNAPLIAGALREAYAGSIPRGRYPAVFLFIEIDPAQVDVNVHPAKKEVRFRKPSPVRDALLTALREALERTPEQPADDASRQPAEGDPFARPAVVIEDLPEMRSFRYPRLPMQRENRLPPPAEAGEQDGTEEEVPDAPWAWCRILGQIGGLYVVLETDEGLVLMDPQAAHERVLYEQLLDEARQGKATSQGLLVPETIELPPRDALLVRQHLDALGRLGFGVSEFGGEAFLVDALPAALGAASARDFLVEFARELERGGERKPKGSWGEEQAARAAGRAAVRARDKLSLEAIEQLVVALARTRMPYTCPHGRPTLTFTSFQELHRKFGRA